MNKQSMKFSKTGIFFVFTFLNCFACLFCLLFYPFVKYVWGESDRYCIKTIVQKKPACDALKCEFLAEALDLSLTKKNYLYHFNLKEGEEKLCKTIFIKEACIKKIKPSTLFVEYSLREPIAYFGNYSNTFIDEEGVFFPCYPFYTPKNLPEVFFGKECEMVWGRKMPLEKLSLLKELFQLFSNEAIVSVDFSKMEGATLGQKEIVVTMKEGVFLRLSCKDYKKEIHEYLLLKEKENLDNFAVLDFRIPSVAILERKK